MALISAVGLFCSIHALEKSCIRISLFCKLPPDAAGGGGSMKEATANGPSLAGVLKPLISWL